MISLYMYVLLKLYLNVCIRSYITCFAKTTLIIMDSIFYLFRDMYKRFSAIFTITQNPAKVVIPESFAEKVKGWLGGNIELFNNVKDQVWA